ncbi:MAG TPA: BTAD domain-containing putative transcriptional regulator [Gemmatimonas sp.]|nr:BTAD domain-containing putative transcriptional regulator [Gemmatimonas sp.]
MPASLHLLGGATLRREDGTPFAGRVAQRHRLALLALLACAPAATVGRERLLALLWPESDAERARNLLNVAVYDLRKTLGERCILSVGDDLRLDVAALQVDVIAFGASLAAGDHTNAVAEYAGPFLDGFHLPDNGELERWADVERARHLAAYAGALEALAVAAGTAGAANDAVTWWRRRSSLDPVDSRVAGQLVEAMAASGNVAGALQQAATHERLLLAEFEIVPPKEFAMIVSRVRAMGAHAAHTAHTTNPKPAAHVGMVSEPALPVAVVPSAAPSPSSATLPATAPATRQRLPVAILGSIGLLAVLAGAAYAIVGRRSETGRPSAPVAPAPAVAARSLAVLPFVNRSSDPANAYFSDGLTEEIISALSKVAGLRVAARTSSFALRDAALDVRAVGDTLGVETVLEGSVRREGTKLRVTAQLVDAMTGLLLWSGEYDRNAADALAVQDEIARAIAGTLELRLPPRAGNAGRPAAPSMEAYDLYLRALQLRNLLNADALQQASDLLDRSIELAPDFALAHAAKASVIAPRMYLGQLPVEQGKLDMRDAIRRAFALDSTLGEAYVALGIFQLFQEWDWNGAERSLRRALQLNPSDPHAWHHLGNYLRAMGRMNEAFAARTNGVALDPLNARTRIVLALDNAYLGRFAESIEEAERAQRLDPMNPLLLGLSPTLPVVPIIHDMRDRPEDVLHALQRVAALRGVPSAETDALRDAFARDGLRGVWRQWLVIDRRQSGSRINPLRVALLRAASGDTLQALDWLERAFAAREPGLIYVNTDASLAALRSQPRFQRIVRAMKFPNAGVLP